ncbi:CWF19-like protein 2-like [Homarus americanus]|uniref:CWF19-like protein 2 n=1 Tax=Homarus americanus TaxID=6706 RepID=A0A8J5TLE5_HOMAM|nr:CWF19-like protein 2-like [Homarus americanus]
MSMSFIEFESSREKDKKRQWEREARQSILDKAKSTYEAKERKEEAARQRGEHLWMLSSVESKLHSHKEDKKKKKKDKKKKKEKKSKKSKRNDSSPSASSDSDAEKGMWVEKSASCVPKTVETINASEPGTSQARVQDEDSKTVQTKRDSWMEMTSLFGTYSRDEIREREGTSRKKAKEEEERRKREAAKPGSHALELNPFYKNGGTGLPEEQKKEHMKPEPSSIGLDAAWLRKALKRAEEQAKLEKRSLEEIAAQRWGSLAKFHELLAEAEGRGKKKQGDSWQRKQRIIGDHNKSRERNRSREENYDRSGERNRSTSSERKISIKRDKSEKGLPRPPDDDYPTKQPSFLSSKFRRPGEEDSGRSTSDTSTRKIFSNRRWQKKDYKNQLLEQETQSHQNSSTSSSSSSESSDVEEVPVPEPSANKDMISGKEASHSAAGAPSQPPVTLLTDKEMNELAAKVMKAELVGNDTQVSKLKAKLEAARAARAKTPALGEDNNESGDQKTEEVIVLTRMDKKGMCRPVSGVDQEDEGGKRRKKVKTHGQDGQRSRYFPDDDQHDLKRMFEREKGTSAEDQNSMFERAAMHNSERLTDDYDIDDMFMSKAALKETAAKQAERDKLKAIQEHKRSERSLESCQWCFDNKEMPKHLIVALGTKSYVCLPPHESLTPGHCLIVPIHHIACSVQADEDLWSEIQNFRKSLVKMFASRDDDCIFFETVKKLKYYPHMVINCVPLPREMGDMAPIYFKKAIMECEAEWAQNKKLVDLKNRDVRRAVPKGLPYFFVDFAMDAGYAHVIEDEQDFPNNFAQEIVGGMLDLDNNLWHKPRKENFDAQRRKVMEFNNWYKKFDPTQDD